MKERVKKAQSILKHNRLDALIISDPSNIFYLSGFCGHDSFALVTRDGNYIITDFRYKQEAEERTSCFEIVSGDKSLYEKTASLIKRLHLKRVGFESGHITIKVFEVLSSYLKEKLHPLSGPIQKLRIIKSADEIKLLKASADIAKRTLKRIIKEVKDGQSEKAIAARIDFLLESHGADSPAFDTIAASGKNASMPHAKPTAKKIKAGEMITLDFGARYNGYSSDLTRTIFVGKIGKHLKLLYSIVKTAQQRAIDKICPGIKISKIDSMARDYIEKKGFGKFFSHATGHSIGIDVHEAPSISSKNHTILKEGMVFTVEPGIYLPGVGGVRIEDMVVVNKKGCEVITL